MPRARVPIFLLVGLGLATAFRSASAAQYVGHPRLLFTSADVSELRHRVHAEATPTRLYDGILDSASGALETPVDTLLAFLQGSTVVAELGLASYLENNDPGFAALARTLTLEVARRYEIGEDDFTSTLRLRTLAFGYDMAFQGATELEREEVRTEILSYLAYMQVRFNYFRYASSPYTSNRGAAAGAAVGLAVLALRNDVPVTLEPVLDAALSFGDNLLQRAFTEMLPSDGSYREGLLYGAWALRMAIPYIEARRRWDGVDWAAATSFQRVAKWLCYEILPEGSGRTNNLNDCLWKTRPLSLHSTYIDWAQARWSSRLAKYIELHVTGTYGYDYGAKADRVAGVLWNRPLQAVDPATVLPTGSMFAERGLYAYRSAWKQAATGDEVLFTFYAGIFHGGHAQEDQGAFTLYAYGDRYGVDAGYPSPTTLPKESQAHSIVLIDGLGQHNAGSSIGTDARIAGSLLSSFADYIWADTRPAYNTHSPLNDPNVPFRGADWSWGYDGGNPVQRSDRIVVVVKGGAGPWLLIADDIQKDSAPHLYDWQLHTDPRNQVNVAANPVRIQGLASSLDVYFASPERDRITYSVRPFEHGGEDPATLLLQARTEAVAPGYCVALVPRRQGELPPAYSTQVRNNATLLRLVTGSQVDLALWNPLQVYPTDELAIQTDARMAVVRMMGGGVEGYFMSEGTILQHGQQLLAQLSGEASLSYAGDTLQLGRSNVGFRAYGPNVREVMGPHGPLPFVRDGFDVLDGSKPRPDLWPPSSTFGMALDPCVPNPFRSQATITFELRTAERVTLAVFDVRGRRVRTLLSQALPPGRSSVTWDGCDACGARLPSGVYLVQLGCGSQTCARKVFLSH